MYQPQIPLIEMSPLFRSRRLGEVELGRLLLLRDSTQSPGVGIRSDALSARGDLAEGVLRLSGGPVRFERLGLEDSVVAIEIAFLIESELASVASRAPRSGDLLVSSSRAGSGVFVAGLWNGADGLLDIASAVIRPFGAAGAVQTVLTWKLVEREQRTRVLLEHGRPPEPPRAAREFTERYPEEPPRRAFVEDSD